jgi:hypothetical protein
MSLVRYPGELFSISSVLLRCGLVLLKTTHHTKIRENKNKNKTTGQNDMNNTKMETVCIKHKIKYLYHKNNK